MRTPNAGKFVSQLLDAGLSAKEFARQYFLRPPVNGWTLRVRNTEDIMVWKMNDHRLLPVISVSVSQERRKDTPLTLWHDDWRVVPTFRLTPAAAVLIANDLVRQIMSMASCPTRAELEVFMEIFLWCYMDGQSRGLAKARRLRTNWYGDWIPTDFTPSREGILVRRSCGPIIDQHRVEMQLRDYMDGWRLPDERHK